MNIPLLCTAVFGVLIFGLASWISVLRLAHKDYYFGKVQGPSSFLTKLNRAHGNTAEFGPLLCVLMLYLGTTHPPEWVYTCMQLTTLCRVFVVMGFLHGKTLEKIHLLKAVGAVGTYVGGLLLTYALFL